jgi:signal peptidase I
MLSPRRWDLVAYWSRSDGDVIYCKRLVGLPGEKLKFDDGKMYVNDQVVEAPEVVAGKYYAAPPGLLPSQARYHDGETIELKGDEYFLIGDNVDVSADSRVYGLTLRSDLVGVADFIYWPLNRMKLLR